MKFVEVSAAKEFAYTRLPDPILNMAVNAVLDSVPAAEDVAPVVHGEWGMGDRANPQMPCCSACRTQATRKYRYCPNCGAKMDGDRNV